MPIKGQKNNVTKALKSHYKDAKPKVFSNSLPEGWVAGCVVVEGMNTTPLRNHGTFADYANFLGKRFLTPHFSAGSKEVHLIFDRLAQTPKYFKQKRRDIAAKVVEGHVCDEIEDSRHIPSNWREDFLNCRNCK